MDFGVPNLRKAKKEKYEHFGVITLEPTGVKLARKMNFNTKAKELLKIDDKGVINQVAFSFMGNDIFIANVNGLTGVSEVKLTKEGNISNKKYYEHIKKLINKDEADEVEFFLKSTPNEFNGVQVFELTLTQPEEEIVDVDIDTIPEVSYDENENQDTSFLSPQPETVEDNSNNNNSEF